MRGRGHASGFFEDYLICRAVNERGLFKWDSGFGIAHDAKLARFPRFLGEFPNEGRKF